MSPFWLEMGFVAETGAGTTEVDEVDGGEAGAGTIDVDEVDGVGV